MKRSSRKRIKAMSRIYSTADVVSGYDYWYFKLLNYILGIYQYTGLPESLPQRELESNLLLTGHAVLFEDKGELVTTLTELYGFDKYYRPTSATFGNALIPFKNLTFGVDAEVIYNNRIQGSILRSQVVDGGLSTYIRRYARLLADIESSIDIYIINSRFVSYPTAQTEQMAYQIEDFNARVETGEMAVLTDPSFLETFRNVDIHPRTNDTLNDLLIARDKILATFFREIGVKFVQEQKKAQLTEDEVVADEQMLVINLDEMLQERQEGLDRVNSHFGTNIKVEINPAYDRKSFAKEENNENTEFTDESDTAEAGSNPVPDRGNR